jgi:ABC-type multidrug transport system ATPase subunit
MNDILITENLSRSFGSTQALTGLSMRVETGNVFALLGPNGAGKTTFLKLAMGLIEPTAGRARLFGEDARALSPENSQRVVSLIEGHVPPGWATAKFLMDLQAGASPSFDHKFALDFYAKRDLPVKKQVGALSKGQKAWLLAGLALASRADLILLDEPAAGLDPAARHELFSTIRAIANDRETTIGVATHIISDIERVADDVAIIKKAKLLLHDSIEELRETVREVELSGELPPMTQAHVQALATKQVGGRTAVLARSQRWNDPAFCAEFAPNAHIRPVGLEDLYLALAESTCPEYDDKKLETLA